MTREELTPYSYMRPDQNTGALSHSDCPTQNDRGRCKCQKCRICGFNKHMAVHCGIMGEETNGRPWGHVFVGTYQETIPVREDWEREAGTNSAA